MQRTICPLSSRAKPPRFLHDDDLPAIGASSLRARNGTRIEMLKDGEFLRISVKRDRERYLIYLPVKR